MCPWRAQGDLVTPSLDMRLYVVRFASNWLNVFLCVSLRVCVYTLGYVLAKGHQGMHWPFVRLFGRLSNGVIRFSSVLYTSTSSGSDY